MDTSLKRLIVFLTCFWCMQPNITLACTDFRLTAKDGSVLISRSMEFGLDLKSNLRTSPRGRTFTTVAPDGKAGLTWKAKYGYVYLDALNVDMSADGMNEKGLSFGALYLPALAQYQAVPADHDAQALSYLNVGDWVLSNFDSVDQVKEAIQKIYVFEQKLPGMGADVFPLHYSIHDASGKSLVIEYIGGQLHLYDNKVGVLTNSPGYDWHITNLINYLHLSPTNPSPVVTAGVTFAATGQGFGMIGLPGDISPPSRFVKIATLLNVVIPQDNNLSELNLAQHIMNNVDIPLGLVREGQSGNATNEFTQWVVFKDLTNKIFYYRTYDNLALRAVSLSKINFDENSPRLSMSIVEGPAIQDMTQPFLKSTSKSATNASS